MRTIVKAIVLASVAIGVPSGARGDDSTDTLLRAAYCVGVLKASIAQMQQSLSRPIDCENSHTRSEAGGAAECAQVKATANELGRVFLDDYEQRHRRYAQYVLVRSVSASRDRLDVLHAVIGKGEQDATAKAAVIDADHPILRKHCAGSGNEFANCVAEYDQVYANIIRCQQHPDRLPF